jgi:hypothetical protein
MLIKQKLNKLYNMIMEDHEDTKGNLILQIFKSPELCMMPIHNNFILLYHAAFGSICYIYSSG